MSTILIADDSQFMRSVLKDILVAGGHTVEEAENGNVAMEKVEKESPDLLLLDIIMPEVDGIDVLKKIGTTQKTVVISAVGQEKMIDEAKSLGAIDYIVKPFENEHVLEVVTRVLAA